jgi:hypothetical protein
VLYIERSPTYLQLLIESLISLAELLNMAVFRYFEVMSGQTLNYFEQNSVISDIVIYLYDINLLIVKFDITVLTDAINV